MSCAAPIVGRERELAELRALLERDVGVSAVVVGGEAGMGKTTLWHEALAFAAATGRRVLVSRAAPAEAQLAFGGLSDLLGSVVAEAVAPLPAPQRHAIEVALLLDEPVGPASEERAIGAALLGALRVLAAGGPVVVAVDDVQWLDSPSARALEFALRRLHDEPITLLLTHRTERPGAPLPLGLERAFPDASLLRIELGGLSLGALHHLLQSRFEISLSRPTLLRVYETSGGNPLYAVELTRALQRSAGAGELSFPESLQELVDERLAVLPEAVQRVLPYVAALRDPDYAFVCAAVGEADAEAALDAALHAGVLERDGARLRFAHPLLRAGVYGRLSDPERRGVHRSLAQLVGEREERALHLALATVDADEEVAAELERAAGDARARGATAAAAQLFERAAELTPAEGDTAAGRWLAASGAYNIAGDQPKALAIAGRLVETLHPGPRRAEALSLLSWANPEGDLVRAAELGRQALAEAVGEPRLEALMHYRLGEIQIIRGDTNGGVAHERRAAELAEVAGDRGLLAAALAYVGYNEAIAGRGVVGESRRAVEIERSLPGFLGQASPSIALGQVLTYTDELDEARAVLRETLGRAGAAGDEEAYAQVLFHLAVLECRAGNWAAAETFATEAIALYRQAGNAQEYSSATSVAALLAALQGRLDEARAVAAEGLAAAERMGDSIFAIHHRGVLGLVELSLGNVAAAHQWLEPAVAALLETGTRELSIYPVVQNEIEALVALGELERAEELSGLLEQLADETGRSWARAVGARGNGLVLGARGDETRARDAFERSLAAHERLPQPFELARTLLARGTADRRFKRKRESRQALECALERFEQLGASVFAARTREELGRLGLRRGDRDALTPTEERVARLAAEGLTNREIAATAFMSLKTVEANLSRVYKKLAIRSRAQLAVKLDARSERVGQNVG